jgi:hypothetical protein
MPEVEGREQGRNRINLFVVVEARGGMMTM